MGKMRNRVIAEQRIYDDPKNPNESDYDVAFPRTVPKAIVDPKTGETMDATLENIGNAASSALAAAKAAQKTADDAAKVAKDAKEVADGAAQAIAAVQNTISVVPSQAVALTYDKSLQTPVWSNYFPDMMELTYGEEQTPAEEFQGESDAGEYTAYFKPKGDYTWLDKSQDAKPVTWVIQRASILAVPTQKGKLYYTGDSQTPTWDGYVEEQMTKEETGQTDAGEYSTTFTCTENYKWPDGSTGEKTATWHIDNAVIGKVPTQTGTINYTGNERKPSFDGYEEDKMTMSGRTTATDAGTYYAEFTPKKNYQWPDNTTGMKTVPWTINKASCTLTIDPATISLAGAGKTAVIAVTRDGDGEVTATSGDVKVATVSKSGTLYFVVTAVDDGTATITLRALEGTNHLASASKSCTVTVKTPKIYGVTWDGSSSPLLSRTDAAKGFANPNPYVKNGSAGSSPFDTLSPWKDIEKVTDPQAGAMVKIPKFWYKLTQSGNTLSIQIADEPTEGFSVCPACMDRGDGKVRDYVLVGRYHCAESTYKSETNKKPQVSQQRSTFLSKAQALGNSVYIMDFATRFTIWLLYIVEFANWNSQATIGKGCGNNSAVLAMGYTDDMPYHTGTTQTSRDTYGLGTQYRWMEGLWDNCYDFLAGCYNAADGLMIILDPASFGNTTGGKSVGVPVSGWIAGLKLTTSGPFPCFINSSTASGGENVFVCDSWNFGASSPVVYVGGNYGQYGDRGMFFVNYTSLADAYADRGSRLLKLP